MKTSKKEQNKNVLFIFKENPDKKNEQNKMKLSKNLAKKCNVAF